MLLYKAYERRQKRKRERQQQAELAAASASTSASPSPAGSHIELNVVRNQLPIEKKNYHEAYVQEANDINAEMASSTGRASGTNTFFVQTFALYLKNIILLSRQIRFVLIRALIIPIAFTIYMGESKYIYYPIEHFGVANDHQPIQSLANAVGSSLIIPYYAEDESKVSINTMHRIMNTAFSGISPAQIHYITDPEELFDICTQTLRGTSKCYGGIQWNGLDPATNLYNYTVRGNSGLTIVDVSGDNSDVDKYVLPLQLAVDNAIRNTTTSVRSIPFTSISNEENTKKRDQSFMNSLKNWIAPALYISLVGLVFHLSGYVAADREKGLTNLLGSMEVNRFARFGGYITAFTNIYFPSWVIIGILYGTIYFAHSSVAVTLFFALFNGLAAVTWAILLGTLFPSAQLAGITAAGISMILAILTSVQVQLGNGPNAPAAIYVCSFLFNPMSFCMFLQLLCESEYDYLPINLAQHVNGGTTYPIVVFIAPIFQIFLYLGLTVILEDLIYGRRKALPQTAEGGNAIEIRNLNKAYSPLISFRNTESKTVHAVSDLSLNITHNQIYSLLGANGSGKSTTLEMIAGIQAPSSGSIVFGPNTKLGICPQKNVLWDSLTVREHIKIWSRLKGVPKDNLQRVADFFVKKCGLAEKADTLAKDLSGGQKRKLQLAIMFTGGSNVCCIDEVSSGLDPVSRRVIWDILQAFKNTHTLILTTHFLDEADLLSDNIAILSKGVLRAEGSPIDLKQRLGTGYRIFIDRSGTGHEEIHLLPSSGDVLEFIKPLEAANIKFRVNGPELEDVFLDLAKEDHEGETLDDGMFEKTGSDSASFNDKTGATVNEIEEGTAADVSSSQVGFLRQIMAVMWKRYIIFRRGPLPEIAFFVLPILVSGVCNSFLGSAKHTTTCNVKSRFSNQKYTPLEFDGKANIPFATRQDFLSAATGYNSFIDGQASWVNNLILEQALNDTILSGLQFVPSFNDFYNYIEANFSSAVPGGLSLASGDFALAYQADKDDAVYYASLLLNMFTNLISNGSQNIITNFSFFQIAWVDSTGDILQYIAYVGLGIAVAPSFAGLYPTFERLSNVRAMQYSNGLRVAPLWAAHMLFNLFMIIIISAIVIGIMSAGISGLYGPGYMFFVLVLYFNASVLMAFVLSLFMPSQLAAFAITAGYQAVMVLVFLIGYLATETFANPLNVERNVNIIQFTIALISPSQSLMRSLFVGFNIFGILCNSGPPITYMGNILAHGGPILYLIIQNVLLFGFLVCWDSGTFPQLWSSFTRFFSRKKGTTSEQEQDGEEQSEDALAEIDHINQNRALYSEGLVVDSISKRYGKKNVVDGVTFGVLPGECMSLLGPNGAGKSTSFNIIRGEVPATSGEIYVTGISVNGNRALARTKLGVCPQFDAMDRMTVSEVLLFYSKIRGLRGDKSRVHQHIDELIMGVGLNRFRGRIASKLSGGNKRKLSLAVSLIGNPSVLLLDEPSSGMDAFAKRIMWRALAAVKKSKAMVLTTHSMEEADALSNRAGILAKKMLAIGRTEELRQRYGGNLFHVHLVCESAPYTSLEEMQEIVQRVKAVFGDDAFVEDRMYQGQIKMAVPTGIFDNPAPEEDHQIVDEHNIGSGKNITKVSQIFNALEVNKHELGLKSYSVFPTRLEEVFLHIIGDYVEREEL